MKNFCKLFGIIAIIAVIGFTMTACNDGGKDDEKDGDNKENGDNGVITVSQLPEFPSGSNPAVTKEAAQAVLAELKENQSLDSIIRDGINEVIDEYSSEYSDEKGNTSFSNKSSKDGSVKVISFSQIYDETTCTGGFETIKGYWGTEDYKNVQFAVGDKGIWSNNLNIKGEFSNNKTEDGITIVKGSIYEYKFSDNNSRTVTTAGTYNNCKVDRTESEKYYEIFAFTVITSKGSVKVIIDWNCEWSRIGKDVGYFFSEDDVYTETVKYSGSLKVYGNNNTLLIECEITNEESFFEAWEMIGYNGFN